MSNEELKKELNALSKESSVKDLQKYIKELKQEVLKIVY